MDCKKAQIKIYTITSVVQRKQLAVKNCSSLQFINRSESNPRIIFPNGSTIVLEPAGTPNANFEISTNTGFVFDLDLKFANVDNLVIVQVEENCEK